MEFHEVPLDENEGRCYLGRRSGCLGYAEGEPKLVLMIVDPKTAVFGPMHVQCLVRLDVRRGEFPMTRKRNGRRQ